MMIFVLIATNPADFGETDIVVAGDSREAAEKQFEHIAETRWKDMLPEDQEFYANYDNYLTSWHFDYTVCGLST